MIIGIPTETWAEEKRVALTPAGAHALAKLGHSIVVQSDAGRWSRFSAESYRDAGAAVVFSPGEVFARADVIVKVMPPTPEECNWLTEHQYLFSGVHFGAANPVVHENLRQRKAVAIGLELIEDSDRNLPVLVAMSEIAGMLLPQIAGRYLETAQGGRGILLGGVPGIPASHVVIIGSGNVGTTAARSFLGAGANVTVLDEDLRRLRYLETALSKQIDTLLSTPYNIERSIMRADVVVGSVMIHGRKTPHIVTESMVKRMRPGSVILDISIDQGGCVETSRPTTQTDPVFRKHDVIHFCVPNIPSSVARTASHAMNNAILSFVEEIAEAGTAAFRENPTLRRGVYLYEGQCTHEGLAALLGWEFVNIDLLAS
jgi:alanine dehydrogenase